MRRSFVRISFLEKQYTGEWAANTAHSFFFTITKLARFLTRFHIGGRGFGLFIGFFGGAAVFFVTMRASAHTCLFKLHHWLLASANRFGQSQIKRRCQIGIFYYRFFTCIHSIRRFRKLDKQAICRSNGSDQTGRRRPHYYFWITYDWSV